MVEWSELSGALFLIYSSWCIGSNARLGLSWTASSSLGMESLHFSFHPSFSSIGSNKQGWDFLEQHLPASTMEIFKCFKAWLDQYTFWEIRDWRSHTTGWPKLKLQFVLWWSSSRYVYLPREKGSQWKLINLYGLFAHLVVHHMVAMHPGLRNITRAMTNVLVNMHRRTLTP